MILDYTLLASQKAPEFKVLTPRLGSKAGEKYVKRVSMDDIYYLPKHDYPLI